MAEAARTTAPFQSLPIEIYPYISAHLTRLEILRLCLVCRDLLAVAEPLLYSSIHYSYDNRSPELPLAPLLRTLLARPDLGTHVRRLTAERCSLDNPISSESLRDSARSWLQTGKLHNRHPLWGDLIDCGDADAYFAILLCHCPNLRKLRLMPCLEPEHHHTGLHFSHFITRNSSWAGHGTTEFSRLQDVRVSRPFIFYEVLVGGVNTDCSGYQCLFYLPAIQRLDIAVKNPDTNQSLWPADQSPPVATTLTCLRLDVLREANLGQILAATPNLAQLWWVWSYHPPDVNFSIVPSVADLDQMLRGLSVVKNTLHDLTISAVAHESSNNGADFPLLSIQGTLDGLADFPVLRRLQLPLPFLVASFSACAVDVRRVLPRNLSYLHVSTDLFYPEDPRLREELVQDALGEWLKNWRIFTPELKAIHIELEGCSDRFSEFVEMYQADGVGFWLHSVP